MHATRILRHATVLATLATACAAAQAAPVQLTYTGSVSGYTFGDLSSFVPLGTAMTLSLTFNDTFSDGSYSFSDDSGPVNGQLQLGANSYTFDNYAPQSYQTDNNNNLVSVGLQFLGVGPAPVGSDLFGLFVRLAPTLSVLDPMRLGFGFTTVSGDLTVTSYRYVDFAGSGRAVPVGTVPLPATPALVGVALLALALTRRRPARTH